MYNSDVETTSNGSLGSIADCHNSNFSENRPDTPAPATKTSSTPSDGNSTSAYATVFHMLALSIGPTAFILPNAFNMVGYIPGIVGTLAVGAFYLFTVRLLLQAGNKLCDRKGKTSLSFVEVVEYSFEVGPKWLHFASPLVCLTMNILFVAAWTGELCFYIVFIGENVRYIAEFYSGTEVDIRIIIIALLIPCILITLPRNLSIFSVSSTVATVIYIAFIVIVLVLTFQVNEFRSTNFESVKSIRGAPAFLGSIFFTLNFTGIIFSLKYDMDKPEKFDSKFGPFTQAVAAITFVNLLFGFFGYLAYGSAIEDTVTLNLPLSNFTCISILVYCLAVYVTYPVCFFVISNIVWNQWVKEKKYVNETGTRIAITLIMFAVLIGFPQLTLYTNICGLICAVFDSVFIPTIVHLLVSWDKGKKMKLMTYIKCAIIFLIGSLLFAAGLYQSGLDIVKSVRA